MPFDFTCPHCATTKTIDEQFIGQTGPCHSCGESIQIQTAGGLSKPPMQPMAHPQSFESDPTAPPVKSRGSGASTALIVGVVLAVSVIGILLLVALLLPAVTTSRTVAMRMTSQNNMKMIALALHNYHDVYQTFPSNIHGDDGVARTSWRASILPFVEQQALAEQYNWNVPWDAPENALVRSSAIPAYRAPNSPGRPNGTSYVAITGAWPKGVSTVMGNPNEFNKLRSITDGTSNTMMIIEVEGLGIEWAEPRDISFDQLMALVRSGKVGNQDDGMLIAFADGAVQFMPFSVSQKDLKAMATRNGKEPISNIPR